MANNKKSKKKIIIFSIIGALLVILTLIVILGSKKEPVYNVQTEKSQRRTLTQVVTATGKIYPEVQVAISPEVSGEVIGLPVREGNKVNRGDLLLKIKPDIYNALRDRANAELTSAKANLQKYAAEDKRATELFDKGLISNAELEATNTAYEMAKAQFDQADAALKQAVENLSKTTIYAPMAGTVSALNVELGERVLGTSQFQGTIIMTVADLSKMEARVDVGENDIILISIGDTARIEVDALQNKKLNGVVYEIGNTAKTRGLGSQEEVTNFEVKIRILDKGVTLRPGMSMTATIETETRINVIAVPIQSVTTRSSTKEKENQPIDESDQMAANDSRIKQKVEKVKEIVFLIENNVAKAQEVTRGISDDSYTEIVSGIEESKEVVSGSYKAINRELEDGVKVKIDNAKKKSKDSEPK